ncbi:O-acetylhomoserine aminocarboxypropyltransferase/cysteine synthase family protein [Desulfovermiculus halophilus]|jgi:O-acetylhomoserine (thiol)-lyase|uniref:O-acetylhomoserine aminocarboxypropyltransferase/cysteine synthase family protein n=1 Tax=Desulfovermiculus halophilus TaxID=339722 RepID=UPI000488B340|nr:aminotransferase class I/II-fold pyridoxal phosphate-dependent enzyme [Desulfovermiculus halophilus]
MPWNPETLALHAGHRPDRETRSRAVPIYQTTSYVFESPEHAAALFTPHSQGQDESTSLDLNGRPENIYTRINNPTTEVLEQRMAGLEGGAEALALSSGASAVAFALMTICQAGDHIVSSSSLYGGTYNLLRQTLPRFGIRTSFVPSLDAGAFVREITPQTKCLFVETVGNPRLDVPDLESLAAAAHQQGIPLIVDNTVATPFLCRPITWGADIVVHSLTKFCAGHGTSMGGAIVDAGRFDWTSGRFPLLTEPDQSIHGRSWTEFGPERAFILRARNVLLRDFGPCLSPLNSFLILQGLETLPLRMEKHCANARAAADHLNRHPLVNWVLYPGLPSHPTNAQAKTFLTGGFGALVGFGIKGGLEAGREFIRSLELFSHLANIGDAKSLAIHPGSTTHSQLSREEQAGMGLSPDFIRLSIGLEHIDDIIADLDQALARSAA